MNRFITPPSESSNEKKSNLSSITSASSRTYSCKYCTRKFSSPQALGGHQNAHRKERKDEKMKKEATHYHPYSTNYQPPHHIPSYGGSSTNPILLDKPYLQWVPLYGTGSSVNPIILLDKPALAWAPAYGGSLVNTILLDNLNLQWAYTYPSSPYPYGNHIIPYWSGVTPYECKPKIESMQSQTVRLDSTSLMFDRGSTELIDFMGIGSSFTNIVKLEQEKDVSKLDLNLKL